MSDFNRRLEREIPRLRRYARALTRNMVLADDLVQETLLRAVQKQHLWEPGTDLRVWLFTIMHNQYVNQLKRIMRDSAIIQLNECAQGLVATTDPTASRQLRELERALGELPEEQREVILLVGLEGMSYDQAAAILNVPVGTIRSRLSGGREALRKLLGGQERRPTAAERQPLAPALDHTTDPPRHIRSQAGARFGQVVACCAARRLLRPGGTTQGYPSILARRIGTA